MKRSQASPAVQLSVAFVLARSAFLLHVDLVTLGHSDPVLTLGEIIKEFSAVGVRGGKA